MEPLETPIETAPAPLKESAETAWEPEVDCVVLETAYMLAVPPPPPAPPAMLIVIDPALVEPERLMLAARQNELVGG